MTASPSLYGTVDIPACSITEHLFEGLTGRGDAVVAIDGPTGRTMTAAQMEDQIRRLAGGLTERGVLPGGTVAILAPNIPEYAVVFHGVCFGGGTVTTINPTYTAPEVHAQLVDAGAVMLVTIPQFVEVAREAAEGTNVKDVVIIGAQKCLSLEDVMGEALGAQAPVDPGNDIAVLPYSSGTTGKPKGVMLTHRNLVANVIQCAEVSDLGPHSTAIAFLPFFHIYGMTVMMNLFVQQKGKIVTMPRFDMEMLLTLIQQHKVTDLYLVPPVALALAQHPVVDKFDLSSLETIFSGAAPLGPETEAAVAERLKARTVQGYGMTEMSPVSHISVRDAVRRGSSGQAVPSTECRVVDPETLEDVPTGEEGELWVRGPQVMKGYLNNPAVTAATFSPDGEWLRTGDLAVIDADGFMFIRDRLKELIKVKGFQVAPAEVEAALVAHPEVADAAVIGELDPEAGELPIAFVVRAPGSEVSHADLSAHCETCLAHYKHPKEYRFIDQVPKSASGKILRRNLRTAI